MVAHVCMESELNEAQPRAWNRSRLTAEARAMMAWKAVQTGSITLTAVGKRFTRDVATLSMTVRRLTERTKRSEAIRERLSRLGMEKDVKYIKA